MTSSQQLRNIIQGMKMQSLIVARHLQNLVIALLLKESRYIRALLIGLSLILQMKASGTYQQQLRPVLRAHLKGEKLQEVSLHVHRARFAPLPSLPGSKVRDWE